MLKRLMVVAALLSLFFVIGCASAPKEKEVRYSLLSSPREILTSNRFVIAPASVMHQYVSSGDVEIDSYLKDNNEIWQAEVAAQLKNKLDKKEFKAEIVQPQAVEFKEKLKSILKEKGRDTFYGSRKSLDLTFYNSVMSALAGQYNATLVVPTLITKNVYAEKGTVGSIKAKWDGVSRGAETGGSKALAFFTGEMDVGYREGKNLTVISLHLEGYDAKTLKFWSNGGFDVRSKAGVGKAVLKEVTEIFKEKGYIKQSIKVAFEPL